MSVVWPDARKVAELRAKLSSLEEEFARWRAESVAGTRLRKHNTQIRNVTATLDALRLLVARRVDGLAADPSPDAVSEIETDILDTHRIWEFFRSKLTQRYVDWLEPYLIAADQFVWDCYVPVRKALDPDHLRQEDLKEPPLVFFNGGWSPFTMSRGTSYEPEAVFEEEFPRQRYKQILEDLPFPVMGVPWYQVRHLPDAVLLGHEVGHAVEDDFKLTERLGELLQMGLSDPVIDAGHRPAWNSWLGEVFGDVFGTLAAGPAFVGALMDLVARRPERIAAEAGDPGGLYPPAGLRVHIALDALAEAGHPQDSDDLRSRWESLFPSYGMSDYRPDGPPIVRALLRTPMKELRDRALIDVFSFAAYAVTAADSRDRMLRRYAPLITDARPLLASARLAFEKDPAEYIERGVERRVLDVIVAAQDVRVRGGARMRGGEQVAAGGAAAGPAAGAEAGVAELTEQDLARGEALLVRLKGLRT